MTLKLVTDSSSPPPQPSPGLVQGQVVCYTGALVSMTHDQFVEAVEAHGGRFGEVGKKGVIVMGEAEWPLARLDGTLRAVQSLEQKAKAGVTVVTESRFVEELGLRAEGENLRQLFSAATLIEILGITRERMRAWVKAGLITPVKTEHGVWYFDFRQVSAARTLFQLTQSGLSAGRIRESLDRLRQWVPELEGPLGQLAAIERHGRLMVRLEAGELVEPDGQLHFDFTDQPAPSPMRIDPGPRTALDWFNQGLEQEREGFLEEASASYRQALMAGGPDAVTCFNLANVLRSLGSKPQALERYAQAVEIDPHFGQAWNNLGTLLAELGKTDEAVAAFRRALAADPDDPRAHYNLADALTDAGRIDEAAEHWRAYLDYDSDTASEWATYARRQLSAT